MQGWYYVVTGATTWKSPNCKARIAIVHSCFDLVESRLHGVASYEVISWLTDIHKPTKCRRWWPQMKLKSKINLCQLTNVRFKPCDKGSDNRKSSEYRVAAAKLRTDSNCPAGESWPNLYDDSIGWKFQKQPGCYRREWYLILLFNQNISPFLIG